MKKVKIGNKILFLSYQADQAERKKEDYDVLNAIIINNHYEVIFASRDNIAEKEFVSWEHNLNNGDNYYNGHYFDNYKEGYRDFYSRAEEIEKMELGTRTIAESNFNLLYGGNIKMKKYDDNDRFEILTDELMREEGKSDTVAGELLRAVNRIIYRFVNDGDRIANTGEESVDAAAKYIKLYGNDEMKELVRLAWFDGGYMEDTKYEMILSELVEKTVLYLDENINELSCDTPDMLDLMIPFCERDNDYYDYF